MAAILPVRNSFGTTVLILVGLAALMLPASFAASGTERVSIGTAGQQTNEISFKSDLNRDGTIVAFDSEATNLARHDTNRANDVFVRNRSRGTTFRISVSSSGEQANGDSSFPAVSGSGRFIAFASDASNLVRRDTNFASDIFVHDRTQGTTTRISVSSDEVQGDDLSLFPSISDNGRFVSFTSQASNLVPGFVSSLRQVFVRDRELGITERVSVRNSGRPGNSDSATSAVSDDGRFVAFGSFATNLVARDANGVFDVFVHDRQTKTTERVSVSSAEDEGNGPSTSPAISEDGRFVVFLSDASNLVPNDTNNSRDVFVRDRVAGITERVNLSSTGEQAGGPSGISIRGGSTFPDISSDGRFVSFDSSASNLVADDTNEEIDSFVRDRLRGLTRRVSVSGAGEQANDGSSDSAISRNGRAVTFVSLASNLVPGDTNLCRGFPAGHCPDIFVQTR